MGWNTKMLKNHILTKNHEGHYVTKIYPMDCFHHTFYQRPWRTYLILCTKTNLPKRPKNVPRGHFWISPLYFKHRDMEACFGDICVIFSNKKKSFLWKRTKFHTLKIVTWKHGLVISALSICKSIKTLQKFLMTQAVFWNTVLFFRTKKNDFLWLWEFAGKNSI